MAKQTEKVWAGDPGICAFCKMRLNDGNRFYDAVTYTGSWANMCPACWAEQTTQTLGTGLGQQYSKRLTPGTPDTHGKAVVRWVKTAG